MNGPEDIAPPSEAERVFDDFLDRWDRGEEADATEFLATCAPELRPEVERMIDDWLALRRQLGGAERPLPGRVAAGYRFLHVLGQGGMGTVYAARDEATGRELAIKVLSEEHEYSDEAWTRFEREALLAAAITHPRCVFVYGVAMVDDRPAILMERMEGSTLEDELRAEEPMPLERALTFVLQVLGGLVAAQRAGVIHRDVKPSNCFLDGEGGVKIGDFGISRTLEVRGDLTLTGQFLGSPHYASPEQVRGDVVDHRTDVYSVGATLYALLAGKPPFAGQGLGEVLAQVLSEPPPDVRVARPEVPLALARLVQQAMAKDPAERPSSLEELAEALRSLGPAAVELKKRRGVSVLFEGPLLSRILARVERWLRAWNEGTEPAMRAFPTTNYRNRAARFAWLARYRVLGSIAASERGEFFLGHDPELKRDVWLHLFEDKAPPVMAREDPMRLRWIERVACEEGELDVYEDPGGTRLSSYEIRKLVLPWPLLRPGLIRLCESLAGAYPPVALEQVWVDRNGQLRILDHALGERTVPPTRLAFLSAVAERLLIGTREEPHELRWRVVPSQVEALQIKVAGWSLPYADVAEARQALESIGEHPSTLTRAQRLVPAAAFLLFNVVILVLRGLYERGGADPESKLGYLFGAENFGEISPIVYGYFVAGLACSVAAFALRGGVWCSLAGLEVILVDGGAASRLRCGLRAFAVFFSACFGGLLLGAMNSASLFTASNAFAATVGALWGAACFLIAGSPARCLVDRNLRTCVVPR